MSIKKELAILLPVEGFLHKPEVVAAHTVAVTAYFLRRFRVIHLPVNNLPHMFCLLFIFPADVQIFRPSFLDFFVRVIFICGNFFNKKRAQKKALIRNISF